jgi:hypothetical protein
MPESVGEECTETTGSVDAGPADDGVVSSTDAAVGGCLEAHDESGGEPAVAGATACGSTSREMPGESGASAPTCGEDSPAPRGPGTFLEGAHWPRVSHTGAAGLCPMIARRACTAEMMLPPYWPDLLP